MGPDNAAARRSPAREGDIIDTDGGLVLPQPPPPEPVPPKGGVIAFLDSRWRFAESSDAAARRAVLLMTATLAATLVTFALFVVLLISLGILAAALAEHVPQALLALVPLLGGTGVAITIYRGQR